jgi:hypothetical protein
MSIIKQQQEIIANRGGEIGTLVHYWWECKMLELLWKSLPFL